MGKAHAFLIFFEKILRIQRGINTDLIAIFLQMT